MIILILGLALCISAHAAWTAAPAQPLAKALGHRQFRTLLVVAMLAGAILIVVGKSNAAFLQVWVPPFAWRECTSLQMVAASVVFASAVLPDSHTRALVRQPLPVGLALAGSAHLLSNGDLASMLLFGIPTLWAVLLVVLRVQKGGIRVLRPVMQWDLAAILLGMIAWGALLVFHGLLFGFALTGPL